VSQLTADPQQLERMGQAGLSFISSQQGSTGRTIAHLKGMTCWPRYPMPPVMTNGAVEDTVWFSSAQTASLEPADFAPMSYGEGVVNMATGSGRGQALLIQREGKSWVLRHYRRGGLVARFNADRYPMTSVSNSRAMQEFGLLREMVSLGLPVPPPVGARRNCPSNTWWARLVGYKADILVLCIPDTRNLAQLLDTEKPSQAVWAAIGRAIADMHSHQINHTDLNCHNILVNSSGQVWLIDFDKCKRSPGDDWKLGNVKRLLRSLNKESGRRHGFKWDPLTWQMVLDAYHGHV
jgi:3-deoxy-D-manno-octulosonic-acid transferase